MFIMNRRTKRLARTYHLSKKVLTHLVWIIIQHLGRFYPPWTFKSKANPFGDLNRLHCLDCFSILTFIIINMYKMLLNS